MYLVAEEFCRGFNLKLTVDATVVVLDMYNTLTHSQVKQMAGRASRSQGSQKCYCYIVDAFLYSVVSDME